MFLQGLFVCHLAASLSKNANPDMIPEPISIAEAPERWAMKKKEDLEANSAMSTSVHRQSPPLIAVSAPQLNGKSRSKPRPSVASRETSSASANGSTRREHRRNKDRMDGVISRSQSARAARYVGPENILHMSHPADYLSL